MKRQNPKRDEAAETFHEANFRVITGKLTSPK
jgi:hypothetical protein